jgi:hypothetical protein
VARYLFSVHSIAGETREPMSAEEMQRSWQRIGAVEEEMRAAGAWVFSGQGVDHGSARQQLAVVVAAVHTRDDAIDAAPDVDRIVHDLLETMMPDRSRAAFEPIWGRADPTSKSATLQAFRGWRDPDSNRGHHDFQERSPRQCSARNPCRQASSGESLQRQNCRNLRTFAARLWDDVGLIPQSTPTPARGRCGPALRSPTARRAGQRRVGRRTRPSRRRYTAALRP